MCGHHLLEKNLDAKQQIRGEARLKDRVTTYVRLKVGVPFGIVIFCAGSELSRLYFTLSTIHVVTQ